MKRKEKIRLTMWAFVESTIRSVCWPRLTPITALEVWGALSAAST